jgi:hypothetical protein
MALDSIYKFREVKKTTEIKPQHDVMNMKRLIDSLPTMYMDQEWVKEHEAKENDFSTPTQKSDDEQAIYDILAKFKKIRESNNNMRSQMRKQQLTPLQQFQQTQQYVDNMAGGKSR